MPEPYRNPQPPSRTHRPLYIVGGAFVALSFVLFVLVCVAARYADPGSDHEEYGFFALFALTPGAMGLPLLLMGVIEQASNSRQRVYPR